LGYGGGEASDCDAIKIAMQPMNQGADAIYTSINPVRHKAMVQEKVPIMAARVKLTVVENGQDRCTITATIAVDD
jgi:hypothetical protein